MHKNISALDRLVAKWRTKLQITIVPEDSNMEPTMNRYCEYRQKIKTQEATRGEQEAEIVEDGEPKAE